MKKLVKMKMDLSIVFKPLIRKVSVGLSIFLFFALLFIPHKSYAKSGEEIFNTLCMVCHKLSSQDLTGPGLAGLTERRTEQWIIDWIRDSQKMIEEGDEQAIEVFEEYNQVPMPGYPQFSDDELRDLIQYIEANQEVGGATSSDRASASGGVSAKGGGTSKSSPYAVWIFIGIVLLFYALYRYKKNIQKKIEELGVHGEAHTIPNYRWYFLLYFVVAMALVYLIIDLMQKDIGMINILLFVALPYLSFGIFLIGSIYRYKNTGFKVSSLSSQFLEGKKLFWGSLPFHWGLFFLFFGHLIAFLFPSGVLAWNGQPIRLLILEFTAFAFGISVLIGLILLIKRRLTTRMLMVVANKMDMVVYIVLFVQILSGLGVAYFVRWGSSWFASVLTPYLRSVFSFDPEIAALVEAPWLVQIHVVSAFVIIGIIPFTRFMHFLVAPFDYAWRRYQVVIWNWNPKIIRISRKYNFGKKPRNH